MEITLILTLPEAHALRHMLSQCAHLSDRSRTISDALGITPEQRDREKRVLDRFDLPRPMPERLRAEKV